MLKGTDTEVLLRHEATGNYISSVGLIGGSKSFPRPIGKGCALQEDNVTVEFTTPPTEDRVKFRDSIRYNMEEITKLAVALGLTVCITPSAVFSDAQLANPAAQEFGCEPDFNAWNKGKANPKPKATNPNLRSCGGHIHQSVKDKSRTLSYVQAFDLFLGVPMLLVDKDTARRELYGKAGAFRPKEYGFEYRTLSNVWITKNEWIDLVWDATDRAIKFIDDGGDLTPIADTIQNCINNSDMKLCEELIKEYKLDVPC